MPAAAPNTIEDLLQRMQEFRKRPVLQVGGQPAMAINAFVVSSLAASKPTTPVQGFLAKAAKKAFDRLRRSQSVTPAEQGSLDFIPLTPPGKTPAERKWVEDIDRGLLDYVVQQGWLSQAPVHAEITDEMGLREPSAVTALGKTFIASNIQGDYANFMPKEGAAGNERTCMRWFILLHEASHLEFEDLQAPFTPSLGRVGKQCVNALNDWVFDVVHQARRQHREVLNECFADVYGAMMLLKSTNFSTDAVATIAQVHQNRVLDRRQVDKERVAQGSEGAMSDHHCTDFALRRMITNTETWRDLSAPDMRNAALRYASDGFLDFIEPTRLTPEGDKVGELLHHDFTHPNLTSPAHMYYLAPFANVAISEFMGEGAQKWFEERLKGHPAQSLMRKLWDEAGPEVMQTLKQQPARFRFDLEALLPSALRKLDHMVYTVVRAHIESVPFQPVLSRVQKIYDQDSRMMLQGLSRASFDGEQGMEMAQWRSNRPSGQPTPSLKTGIKPA